jgi:PAS domain-containing protein
MQKEITNNLQYIIAKLELKQLEFIDKLSKRSDDYVIRCITSPIDNRFIAVNGDWETVTGFDDDLCVDMEWSDFIKGENVDMMSTSLFNDSEFVSFVCDIVTKCGDSISVDWKSKYFPEIDGIISIGRLKK